MFKGNTLGKARGIKESIVGVREKLDHNRIRVWEKDASRKLFSLKTQMVNRKEIRGQGRSCYFSLLPFSPFSRSPSLTSVIAL